eukprot:4278-Pelagomonas_calceolata.AAC.8
MGADEELAAAQASTEALLPPPPSFDRYPSRAARAIKVSAQTEVSPMSMCLGREGRARAGCELPVKLHLSTNTLTLINTKLTTSTQRNGSAASSAGHLQTPA